VDFRPHSEPIGATRDPLLGADARVRGGRRSLGDTNTRRSLPAIPRRLRGQKRQGNTVTVEFTFSDADDD
jgi:hypothetical protein